MIEVSSANTSVVDPLRDYRGIVYCIFNKMNGKRYIGLTAKSFNGRYSGGRWWAATHNRMLSKDFIEFGAEAFEVNILVHGYPKEDLGVIEGHYIKHYETMHPDGYNLVYDTAPGYPVGRIYKVSRDLQEMSVFEKEPGRENSTWTFACRPCADSTKLKISIANRGKKRTPEERKRISDSMRGRKQTQEAIAKRSASLQGKHAKKVAQIDPKTNQVIAIFDSIQDAARSLGLISSSNLSSVCKGRQKTAAGYIFKYHETN